MPTQSSVPREVYDMIDDPKQLGLVDRIIADHHLPSGTETYRIIDPIPNLVVAGKLHPAEIADRVREGFRLTPEAAHALATDIVVQLLLPLRKWLPEVERLAVKWNLGGAGGQSREAGSRSAGGPGAGRGGAHTPRDIGGVPVPRPAPVQKVSANAFVRSEVEKYKLSLPDPVLQARFEKILSQFLAKAKTRGETLEALTRSVKVGGLELQQAASEQLLDGLLLDAKTIPPQPVSASASKPDLEPGRGAGTPPIVHGSEVDPRRGVLAPPITEAPTPISEVKPKPLPPRTVVKFDPVTVRPEDEKEIEEQKKKPILAAPLALDAEALTQDVISRIRAANNLALEARHKLHAIVKTRLKDIRDQYATRRALESKEAGLGWSGSDLTQALEVIEAAYEKEASKGQARLAKEKQEFVQERVAKRFSSKESAPTSAPTSGRGGGTPPIAEAPVTPRPIKLHPVMRDVAAPRKLSGPVEELRQMTIATFRRLGKGSAAEAEVLERVHILEEESYGQRLAAITAWRQSPLYETYAALLSEALSSGKSVADVLALHRQAGEDVLTGEEVQALTRLNGKLRV